MEGRRSRSRGIDTTAKRKLRVHEGGREVQTLENSRISEMQDVGGHHIKRRGRTAVPRKVSRDNHTRGGGGWRGRGEGGGGGKGEGRGSGAYLPSSR